MKKTLFSLILLGITYLMLEMLTLGAYYLSFGNYSLFELQTSKQGVIDEANHAGLYVAEDQRGEDRITTPIVHPYFGFTLDGKQRKPECDVEQAKEDVEACYQRIRGYADRPFPARSEERLIVALLGGSFARGTARYASDAFSRRFAGHPALKDRELVLFNLAGAAFKQPQQLARLTWYYSLGAEFDLVINLDGFNEMAGSYYNFKDAGVHPSFPVSWNHRVAKQLSNEKLALYAERKIQRDRHTALARLGLMEGLRYSPMFNFFWRLADQQATRRILALNNDIAQVGNSDNPEFRYEQVGPEFDGSSDEAFFSYTSGIWRDSSLALQALAEGRGAQYFHFLQPNQYIAGNKQLSDWEVNNAVLAKGGYGNVYRQTRDYLIEQTPALQASGVRFNDLTYTFADVSDTLYVDNCCHMNEKGYTLVADRMAQLIVAQLTPEAVN